MSCKQQLGCFLPWSWIDQIVLAAQVKEKISRIHHLLVLVLPGTESPQVQINWHGLASRKNMVKVSGITVEYTYPRSRYMCKILDQEESTSQTSGEAATRGRPHSRCRSCWGRWSCTNWWRWCWLSNYGRSKEILEGERMMILSPHTSN
jgi:hypothetical protein